MKSSCWTCPASSSRKTTNAIIRIGNLAAHVLGFTGIDNQGLTGVELILRRNSAGMRGSVSFLPDARGGEMPGSFGRYDPRATA